MANSVLLGAFDTASCVLMVGGFQTLKLRERESLFLSLCGWVGVGVWKSFCISKVCCRLQMSADMVFQLNINCVFVSSVGTDTATSRNFILR